MPEKSDSDLTCELPYTGINRIRFKGYFSASKYNRHPRFKRYFNMKGRPVPVESDI